MCPLSRRAALRSDLAPLLIVSGGFGKRKTDSFDKAEAEVFVALAELEGVPAEAFLVEFSSVHMGKHVWLDPRRGGEGRRAAGRRLLEVGYNKHLA